MTVKWHTQETFDSATIIFHQDSATPHTATATKHMLLELFGEVVTNDSQPWWPPRSPDLTVLDFTVFWFIKDRIFRYEDRPQDLVQLESRICDAFAPSRPKCCSACSSPFATHARLPAAQRQSHRPHTYMYSQELRAGRFVRDNLWYSFCGIVFCVSWPLLCWKYCHFEVFTKYMNLICEKWLWPFENKAIYFALDRWVTPVNFTALSYPYQIWEQKFNGYIEKKHPVGRLCGVEHFYIVNQNE